MVWQKYMLNNQAPSAIKPFESWNKNEENSNKKKKKYFKKETLICDFSRAGIE